MKTGIIYARVSSEKSVQKETPISSQIEACLRFAKDNNILILKTFTDEGISGSTDRRPAFQEAVKFAVENKVDYFIVFDTSRFARNIEDAIYYKKLLRKNSVQIAYVTQPLPTDPVAQFLSERIFEMFDQYYTIFASVNVKRGMRENARLGYINSAYLPVGYTTVKEGKKKKIVKDESSAYIYFEILKLFKSGLGSKTIAKILNEKGLLNRNRKWSHGAVLKVLKSPIYKGVIKFENDEFYHPHLAYISSEEWEWIQEELRRRKENKGHAKSDLLFLGLLTCGKCGSPMVTDCAKNRYGTRYHYYVCQKRKNKGECTQERVRADLVDDFLLKRIVFEVFSGERLKQVAEAIKEKVLRLIEDYREEEGRLIRRLSDINRSISNLLLALEKGILTDEITNRVEELKKEKTELEVKLELLRKTKESISADVEIDVEKLKEVIMELYLNGEKRAVRRQFAMMIERVEYDRGMFKVKYKKQFLEEVNNGGKLVGPGGLEPPTVRL